MSRVRTNEKYMNTNRYDSSVTGESKMRRSKMEKTDFTKTRNHPDQKEKSEQFWATHALVTD